MNYDELMPWPTTIPKGIIAHIIALMMKTRQIDPANDAHLLCHVLCYAAGKTVDRIKKDQNGVYDLTGFALADDYGNSDLVTALHKYLPQTKQVKGFMGEGKTESIVVEPEPNWGVVATACRGLLTKLR